jgi:hypothetical protein
MNAIIRSAILASVAVVASVAGCTGKPIESTGCTADADCPENNACNTARGLCICIADASCIPDEFCNV